MSSSKKPESASQGDATNDSTSGIDIENRSNGNESHQPSIDPDHARPESAPLDTEDDMSLAQVLERLVEAEVAMRKHQDDVLRVQAEMQNLRRRAEQDVEKAHKYGQERFASELLAVIDNLERALEAASGIDDERVKAIYDGVDLTLKSFTACFKKFHIEAIDPLGEPFNPQLHQAISMQENPEVEPNTVTGVLQKGYTLHGRVIRPAMVLVSK
jgi:molecular chaperone GrpE